MGILKKKEKEKNLPMNHFSCLFLGLFVFLPMAGTGDLDN